MRTANNEQKKAKKKSSVSLKALLILILALMIAIAGVTAYSYISAYSSLNVSFTEDSVTADFGKDYPSTDFIKSFEGEVIPDEESLDTRSLGYNEMNFTVTKPVIGGLLNPSKEFKLAYEVVDKVPPYKIWDGDGTVLERGTEFDINKVIAYGDNADPEPSVEVKGKVDMDTNGSYPLKVTVTDESGNKTKWDLTVEVADSVPSYSDDSARTPFSDFVSEYKGDGKAFGIDVSEWQDDIDFKAVKDAGCEFVIIRIGYGAGSEIKTDSKFDNNFKNARDAGLKVGVYLYSYDDSEESAWASADWVAKKLGGEKLDLPVAFDWEDFGSFQTYKMSFSDLNTVYDAFAEELAEYGYDCMLYGSKNYLEKIWEDTDTRTVWLAHYTEKTDYKSPFRFWQASCTGRIEGISGDVDMDIMY